MLKLPCVICLGLATFPAFSQPANKYEVATIMEVKPHAAAGDGASGVVRYDISVKVGGTIYLVLYTPSFGMSEVKYSAGRNLLVLVGEKTITYNDIMGNSLDVPIISRKSVADAKQSK